MSSRRPQAVAGRKASANANRTRPLVTLITLPLAAVALLTLFEVVNWDISAPV